MNANEPELPGCGSIRHAVIAMASGGLFVFGMTTWTWIINGSVTAAHILTDFAMPVGIVWMSLFVYAIWLGLRRRLFECLVITSLWTFIALTFNGSIAGKATSSLEMSRSRTLADDSPPLRSMIVLGGSVFVAHDGVVEVSPEGQRVVLAAQYWHAGKTKSLVISGGQAVTDNEPHSKNVRKMLESLNVPSKVIFELSVATNTTAEMQDLIRFFENTPDGFPDSGEVGLITSAYHMHRSMRLAEDSGLSKVVDLVPMPCCYRRGASFGFTPRRYVPRANSGNVFAIALKERLAALVGR